MHIAVLCNGSTADSDSVCRGSNPFTAAKKKQVPTGACFFFISFKRIRTCEGFGVWKMCRRHIFSRKREGGTAREAWGVPSGESARRSRRRRSSLLPLPKRSKCQPVLASFLFHSKGFEPVKVSAFGKCAGGTFSAESARAVPHAKRGVSRAESLQGEAAADGRAFYRCQKEASANRCLLLFYFIQKDSSEKAKIRSIGSFDGSDFNLLGKRRI